jgi:murein DD-endopeptidase MepM/ murein hydrolase activator NlpD
MIVFIEHDGTFKGYRTEYMHLSEITVINGTYVNEGDLIGYTGCTGGSFEGFNTKPHLHFQVRYNGDIVKAEGLVPSTKFTEQNTGFSASVISYYNQNTPRGQAVVIDGAAGTAKSADRSVAAAGQSRSELLERGAETFGRAANVFAGAANLVYQAIGSFLEGGTIVSGPMVFDFETGLWSDDEPV